MQCIYHFLFFTFHSSMKQFVGFLRRCSVVTTSFSLKWPIVLLSVETSLELSCSAWLRIITSGRKWGKLHRYLILRWMQKQKQLFQEVSFQWIICKSVISALEAEWLTDQWRAQIGCKVWYLTIAHPWEFSRMIYMKKSQQRQCIHNLTCSLNFHICFTCNAVNT